MGGPPERMAGVKAVGGMKGVPEFKKILQSLSEDTTSADERVQGYILFHELLKLVDSDGMSRRICEDVQPLCRCIQRDVVSPNEDVASLALKILGFLLHRRTFVTKLPDNEACKFLLTLLALITTTSKKRVCSLGLWCLAVQELKTSLLASHLKMIIAVVLHGIDNPLGSVGITYEAFQAVMQLSRQLPLEMRDVSWTWAPPVYQKLLNGNIKMVELARNCLFKTQAVLLPPLPRLSEAVAADIRLRLLSKMEDMIKSEGRSACIAVQAWGWLVKLLRVKSAEEKALVNVMLKLFETPFLSPSTQVRAASQVAWVSVIDSFVPLLGEAGAKGSPGALATPDTGVQLSHKRLKLLLTPLLNTMSWDKDVIVQRSCCRTWIYLLCKLGQSVNELPIFGAAVVPMLETVFKLNPKNRDGFVWQACVDLLTNVIACKRLDEISVDPQTLPSKGLSLSPKTPVGIIYTGVFSESHHENVSWSSWHLNRLESLMKLVHLLWSRGVEQLVEVKLEDGHGTSVNGNFEAARECWKLLVRGVEAEGRNTVRPTSEHVAAVHLLLEFLSGICTDRPSKNLLLPTWALVEILIDILGPVVVASSFYRIRLQYPDTVDDMVEKHEDCDLQADSSPPNTVTPIVYISAAWFKLVFETSSAGQMEDVWLQAVEKLVTTGRGGFDVMGNYHGFARILDRLAEGSYLHQEESPSVKKVSKSEAVAKPNWYFLLAVWRLVAEKLKDQVERSNDVPHVGGSQGDSGYQVVLNVLLLPIKCFLLLSPQEHKESTAELHEELSSKQESPQFGSTEAELLIIEGPWFKLFDSVLRVSSLKNPQPNSFISGLFHRVIKVMKSSLQEPARQVHGEMEKLHFDSTMLPNHFLRFLGDVVSHALKHAEVSNLAMLAISRKRRKTGYGASSVRVQCMAGMELEDANNLKNLLTVASRLLTVSHEKYMQEQRHFSIHEPVLRILGALTSLMQHVTSQNDSVLLLQALVQPMTCWFTSGFEAPGSRADETNQARHLPVSLLEGLAQAWDGLLLCLQTCRPSLIFDSSLLRIQAPSLAPAFLHYHDAISNRTLAFWEVTYGIKAVTLSYPPGLVEVFKKLKQKVDISLPGWTMRPVAAKERYPQNFYRQPVTKTGRHLGGRIHLMMSALDKRGVMKQDHQTGSGGSREMNSGPSEWSTMQKIGPQVNHPTAHMKNFSDTGPCIEEIGELPYVVNGADDACLEQQSEFMPTPEGNAVIDALVNMDCVSQSSSEEIIKSTNPDRTTISPTHLDLPAYTHTSNAAKNLEDSQPVEVPNLQEITNLLQNYTGAQPEAHVDSGMRQLTFGRDKQCEPAREVQMENDAADKVPEVIVAVETPPTAFNDGPPIAPKKPVGGERPQGSANAGVLQVTVASDGSKGSQAGSKLPGRRKKLKFQDDSQEVEYVVIPQSQRKKGGPLTDRQREVRLSQRTSGQVVKTYTAADFSQSVGGGDDELVNSQAVDEAVEDACKENIPSNLRGLQLSTSGEAAGLSKTEKVACSPGKHDSTVADEYVKTFPLGEIDYMQLKDRLRTLLQNEPTLTFQQIFQQEQYESLPRLIQKRLGSYLIRLRKKGAKSTEITNTAELEAQRADEQPERVLEPSSSGQKANPGEGRDLTQDELSEELIPSSRRLRRKSQLHGHSQKSKSRPLVNLRSSGKLRGGKHWRINSEMGRVITTRLGIKKVVAKRRRICNNLASKVEEKVPATGEDKGVHTKHADSRTKLWGMQMRAHTHKESGAISLVPPARVQEVSASKMHDNPPSKLIGSNDETTDLQALQPITHLELSSEMQESSPFQVRQLNRGVLASAYITALRVADDGCAQDYTRANNHNPRKCRAPKRFPSEENNLDADPARFRIAAGSITEAECAKASGAPDVFISSRSSDAVQPAPPLDINREGTSNACASMEMDESPPILVCLHIEGPPFQPRGGTREEENIAEWFLRTTQQQPSSCSAVAQEGITHNVNLKINEDFQTPAGSLPVGLEPDTAKCKAADRPGVEGLQSHCQTEVEDNPALIAQEMAGYPGKEPVDEVQALLDREDVQVCQVLSALLASSKWKGMEVAESIQADKLLHQLREAIAHNDEAGSFVTPPTHF